MLREILGQLFSLFSGFYCVFRVDGGSDIGLFTMNLSVNYILSSFVYFFYLRLPFQKSPKWFRRIKDLAKDKVVFETESNTYCHDVFHTTMEFLGE